MNGLQKRGSYTPWRVRERRAYQLAVGGGVAGLAGVVGLVLGVVGVIGTTLPIVALAAAAICAFLFRRVVAGWVSAPSRAPNSHGAPDNATVVRSVGSRRVAARGCAGLLGFAPSDTRWLRLTTLTRLARQERPWTRLANANALGTQSPSQPAWLSPSAQKLNAGSVGPRRSSDPTVVERSPCGNGVAERAAYMSRDR